MGEERSESLEDEGVSDQSVTESDKMDTEQQEDGEITGRWQVTKTVNVETGTNSNLVLADLKTAGNVLDYKMATLIREMGNETTIRYGFAYVNECKSCNRSMSVNLHLFSREVQLPRQRIGITVVVLVVLVKHVVHFFRFVGPT